MKQLLLILFLFLNSFSFGQKTEVHGHRGFRGLFPENTLTAFRQATKLGVDYLELDVIITKDSQVVVSHEPWFNPHTCTSPEGNVITKRNKNNLHKLTYSEIKKYDCGKRGNKKFPQQAKLAEYKPLLSEVIETMEAFAKENNLPPVKYNIEIKNNKFGDGKYHFDTKVTSKLLYDLIKKFNINNRVIIQSFDVRCLKEIHKIDSELKIGLLIANFTSVKLNISKLGFTPYCYNPNSKICKQKTIEQAHKLGCKVIVWTVNSEKEMKKFIDLDVDGIITDYPNIAFNLKQ